MIIGNWKMNKDKDGAQEYLDVFLPKLERDAVLAVPFPLLSYVSKRAQGTNLKVAAQNIHHEEEGAYTGEVSAQMVKDFAEYVILGHSERRKYFNETNELINRKIRLAQKYGLHVVYCIGETQSQRDDGQTEKIVERQLVEGLKDVNYELLTVAYEPVWAIGTGNTATPKQANEMHQFIKSHVKALLGKKVDVIYGGSVKPGNAAEILNMQYIDGCLPGGASLDPESFLQIIKAEN